MQTISGFVKKHRLTATAVPAASNPNMPSSEWSRTARHWKMTLRYRNRSMTVHFSQGPMLTEPPTVEDLVSSLQSDAGCVASGQSFAEFASELGYNPDSIADRQVYLHCQRLAKKLSVLLGTAVFSELLTETEPD